MLTVPRSVWSQANPLAWPRREPAPTLPEILVDTRWAGIELAHGRALAVDVRSEPAWRAGHLPGAISMAVGPLPLPQPSPRLRERLSEVGITGRETLILYADSVTQDRLGVAFFALESTGCTDVKILRGGLEAWRREGGEVTAEPTFTRPIVFEGEPREDLGVNLDWVLDHLGHEGIEIIDLRDREDLTVASVPEQYSRGHIPHSLPYHFRWLPDRIDEISSPGLLQQAIGKLGPRPETPVNLHATFVLYGHNASEPSLFTGYLVFRMAGLEARLFRDGWEQWFSSPRAPVIRILSAQEVLSLRGKELKDHTSRPAPLIIDLRESLDFRAAHLPGAQNIPFVHFAEQLEALVEEWAARRSSRDITLIFYCYGPECIRSRNASTLAARMGFLRVGWFRGGIREWERDGLPVIDERLRD